MVKLPVCLIPLSLFFLFAVTTPAHSSTQLRVITPKQYDRISGEPLILQVKTDSASKQSRVYVTAVLTYPGGAIERIPLSDDGLTDGDIPGDGIFIARLEHLRIPGDYSVRAKAWIDGVEAWSDPVSFTFIPSNPISLPSALQKNASWDYPSICGLLAILVLGLVFLLLKQRGRVLRVSSVPDFDNVTQEFRRLRTEMGAIAESVKDNNTMLTSHLSAIELQKDPADGTNDVYSLRLELESTRKAIEAWKETSIDYFDTLQRGIEEYGEEDPRGKALLHDASLFARFCAARGLERITAQPGDPLVDGLFQVVDEEVTSDAPADTILSCTEWGYRSGTIVYKRAKVVLAKAPTDQNMASATTHL